MSDQPNIKPSFGFRIPNDDDLADLLRLFRRCFHVDRSTESWKWRYQRNPNGNGHNTIAVTEHDQQVAAHYAGYPIVLRDSANHRRLTALHICDIMTAKEHRGVGRGPTSLMARTTDHFYTDHCTGKVAFNFGFNTASSKGFSLRFMGAQEIEDAPLWVTTASQLPQSSKGYRISRIDAIDPGSSAATQLDRFFERAAQHYGPLIERTSAWLNWRYLQPPKSNFKLFAAFSWGRMVGWGVFKQGPEGDLRWCDALTLPHHVECTRSLISAALSHIPNPNQPAQDRPRNITCWFSERPQWWARELHQMGFERRPEPHGIGMVCVPHQEADSVQLLKSAYYAWGDGDLA